MRLAGAAVDALFLGSRAPVDAPAVALAQVAHPVVQPVRPPLPELDRLRPQQVAAPVRRPRDLVRIARAELDHALLERLVVRQHAALRRRPGAQAAAVRAAGEVGVGLLVGEQLDRALEPDLALERVPVDRYRAVRVRRQLPALAALAVGVEADAT